MSDEQEMWECITMPFRQRERTLELATILGELFDAVVEALTTGHWSDGLPTEVAGCKEIFTKQMEKAAEWEYQALIRGEALQILERHPGMTAAEVVTLVDSHILELAITPST